MICQGPALRTIAGADFDSLISSVIHIFSVKSSNRGPRGHVEIDFQQVNTSVHISKNSQKKKYRKIICTIKIRQQKKILNFFFFTTKNLADVGHFRKNGIREYVRRLRTAKRKTYFIYLCVNL